MLSDSPKSFCKMASEDSQKNIAKKYKKMWNCPASLAIFEALTINPTKFFRPPFNSQFLLSFNFNFSNKTPGGLKHEKIRPKVYVGVFLTENSCLNWLKVDRIQDIEKK